MIIQAYLVEHPLGDFVGIVAADNAGLAEESAVVLWGTRATYEKLNEEEVCKLIKQGLPLNMRAGQEKE